MILLVSEVIEPGLLQGFPDGVEIAFLPKEAPLSEQALRAEFAVAAPGAFLRSCPT